MHGRASPNQTPPAAAAATSNGLVERLRVEILGRYAGALLHDKEEERNSTENATRARLAAHPADELLDLDAIQASHDALAAEPEHREALTVEVFPLSSGRGIAVHRSILEFDAHLAEQVGHGGRVARSVGAV
jgi:hypothetical protein